MMKLFVFLFASLSLAQGNEQGNSPVSQVMGMLADLNAKVVAQGAAAQKTFDEFSEWCEDRSKNGDFEIKTGKAEVAELKATIEQKTASITSLSTKVEELAASISSDDADLQGATTIRNQEKADFTAQEKDLVDVIGTLERAIMIIEKEMKKGSASMMQLKSAKNMVDALSTLVEASVISSADSKRLAALVQSSQDSSDSDEETGAPAAAVYSSSSGGIVGTLTDLLSKAQDQLGSARKGEQTSLGNYQNLKQSLSDEIRFANNDMHAAKKGKAEAEQSKATAQGDLSVTQKDLDEDTSTMSTLHQDCMTGAADFQSETKSRGEELKALSTAEKVLKEALDGATEQTYSFVQVFSQSGLATGADLANFEAVRFIRDLARKQKSTQLAQLASRMASAVRFASSNGADPFAKVKGLIQDMLATLEGDAQADASHEAYCDKETGQATEKKAEKKALVEKLSTQIDSMSARGSKLKEEVATLNKELAQLASSQAEMNKIRSDEKSLYNTNHAEMKQGVQGVQKALSVLKEYYASEDKSHDASDEAGSGIIGMLEVVESDFTKGMAEMEVSESMAAGQFERVSEENKAVRTMKGNDAKYKNKEAAGLAKSTSESSSDLAGTHEELAAIEEYLGKLEKMCVAKAEPYAEKVARRQAELDGLKEALSILEGEAVLIQQNSNRALRGRH